MKQTPEEIQRIYLTLTLLNTLAASFIWGINTLFLLEAGLSNAQAFAANAFFTVGQVIFEVPTGIVADTMGRKVSYLLGTLTLSVSTLLYLWAWQIHGPFWAWAAISMLLGLGFTFFSGATEAWLVDALKFTGFKGGLESVFSKAQMVGGAAMLVGSISGGIIAQATNLGVPYILRAATLALSFLITTILMKDLGFKPQRSEKLVHDIKKTFSLALHHGLGNPKVRGVMLMAPFISGVSFYVFYAMQPHLLQQYGDEKAYAIAGLAAAIMAGAQIVGGVLAGKVKQWFNRRTSVLLFGLLMSVGLLLVVGLVSNFWVTILLLVLWGLISAAVQPVRQSYINEAITSDQRATVLSFDSLLGSSGGVVTQPLLGRIADTNGYAASFLVGSGIQLAALPWILAARRQHAKADILS